MNKDFHNIVEPFIFGFKQSIDDICEKYGYGSLFDFLADAGMEYDGMRGAELEAILVSLAYLKKHVDNLFEDYLTTSIQFKTSDNAAPEADSGKDIPLVEMLMALDSQLVLPERHGLSKR